MWCPLLLNQALARPDRALLADPRTSAVPRNPDDRTIIHVLNRLGYGPRPGDVDRIRSMGLDAYIDQQLHPERVPDTATAGRRARLTTVGLSSRHFRDVFAEIAVRHLDVAEPDRAFPGHSVQRERFPGFLAA